MKEIRSEFPRWLEFSGLPEYVNKKIRRGAWSVFKKVVELDCERNIEPGVVEISLEQLGARTGLPPDVTEKCLTGLRRKGKLACFIPDNPEEDALVRVVVPLHTPVSAEEVRSGYSSIFPPGKDFFRYHDTREPSKEQDKTLQEIVDMYFNSIGLEMNLFILDELRLIRQRFTLSEIKKVFELAKRLEIRNLRWVIRQLVYHKKKHEKEKKER